MHDRSRILLLAVIMITTCILISIISIYPIYRTSINEERERLRETAKSQARLIESIAKFDEKYRSDYPEGSFAATLSQIMDAHKNYKGFGETGEFTLARREGDNIVFLLNHRHHDDQP